MQPILRPRVRGNSENLTVRIDPQLKEDLRELRKTYDVNNWLRDVIRNAVQLEKKRK